MSIIPKTRLRQVLYARFNGANTIMLTGLILITLAISSMVVDASYLLAFQNRLQTAADAGALAATMQLIKSNATNASVRMVEAENAAEEAVEENVPGTELDPDDISIGYVDPATKSYRSADFAIPPANTSFALTGGFNAVRVAVKYTEDSSNGPVATLIAKMFNVQTMNAEAYSVALMDQSVTSVGSGSGLRPIYACQAQVNRAFADGNPHGHVAQVYGQKFVLDGNDEIDGCPELGTGNWGFADLRDCEPGVPGANDTANWFSKGYEGTVEAGKCYSSQPGNFLTNNNVKDALDKLIEDKTVILLPVVDTFDGTGSNTELTISSFVGFVITGYVSNGSSGQRHIEGYFTQALCRAGCTTGNTATGPGVAVVKLRLAADQNYESDPPD